VSHILYRLLFSRTKFASHNSIMIIIITGQGTEGSFQHKPTSCLHIKYKLIKILNVAVMFAKQESLYSFLNVLTASVVFTSDGKLFHARGAAIRKARSPRRRRLQKTNKSLLSTERKATWRSRVEAGCSMSVM